MNNLKSIKLRVEGRIFLADAWIHKIRNQPFYAPAYRSDIFEYVTQKALYDLRNENNITTILLLMSARQMTANKVYIIEQAIKGLTLDNERAVCCFLKEVKQEYDHLIDTFLPEPTSLLQLRCYLEAELLSGLRKPCYQDWSIHDLMKAAQPQEMDELLRVFQGASLKEQAALVKILCNLLPPEEQGSYEHLKFIGGWYRDNPDQTFKFSMHKAISYEEYAFLAPEEISVIWGITPLPLEVSHFAGKEWTAFYNLPDSLKKGWCRHLITEVEAGRDCTEFEQIAMEVSEGRGALATEMAKAMQNSALLTSAPVQNRVIMFLNLLGTTEGALNDVDQINKMRSNFSLTITDLAMHADCMFLYNPATQLYEARKYQNVLSLIFRDGACQDMIRLWHLCHQQQILELCKLHDRWDFTFFALSHAHSHVAAGFLDILEEAIQDGRATSISPNEVHTILRTALADNRITLERVLNFLSSYNQVPSFHTQVEDEFKFYCSLLKEAFETLEEGQSNVLEHLKGRNNPALAIAICYLLNETNPFKHMDEFYLNNFKYFLMNQCTPSHISGDTYREYASSALSHMISKERLNEADLDKVWSHIEKTMPSEDVRLLKRRFGYDLTSSEAQ